MLKNHKLLLNEPKIKILIKFNQWHDISKIIGFFKNINNEMS